MRLSRASYPRAGAGPPVRLVHVGPGAFFRSLVGWCTSFAGDGWGIAATGRTSASIAELAAQDGLCSVLVRGPVADELRVLSDVTTCTTVNHLGDLLRAPEVSVVTLTVTEAAYRAGSPIMAGLARSLLRRDAPLTVLSCDNLVDNGRVLKQRLLDLEPELADRPLTFPSSVVDRITPAATDDDRAAAARLLGLDDRAVVVTEPALEWIIEDDFAAGRPIWERAGATIVEDGRPWAKRKLRFLNAGHSLLAYEGGCRGHRFVHEAVADPLLGEHLHALWAETGIQVEPAYLDGLLERWANARLPHALGQIAADGSAKLPQRLDPSGPVAAGVVGAWVAHLRGATAFAPRDERAGPVTAAPTTTGAVHIALSILGAELDPEIIKVVVDTAEGYLRR